MMQPGQWVRYVGDNVGLTPWGARLRHGLAGLVVGGPAPGGVAGPLYLIRFRGGRQWAPERQLRALGGARPPG